jgi:hypothetical protein
MFALSFDFDVVVGAGHAGVEAAPGSTRLGLRAALLTMNAAAVAQVAPVDDTIDVQSTDPTKQDDYIDRRLVSVGYSIYLGGYHLYCNNHQMPVFLPDSDINFMLANAQSIGDTIYEDRSAAQHAAAAAQKTADRGAPVAYYRAVGVARIAPTVFSPATTPRIIQTLRTAMMVLADDVKNEMTVLAGTLIGTAVLKMIATRVIRWSQGHPEAVPSLPPSHNWTPPRPVS